MSDVVAAEWHKLRTARTTAIVLGVVFVFAVLMLAIAWYFVGTWDGLSAEGRARASMGSLPELLGWITSLVMAVFGTIAISTEYASGMIRTTFVAMPDRPRVLVAKAFVVAAVTFAATEVALFATLLGSAAIVGDRPIPGQPPLDGRGLALVVAMGATTVMFAMIGLSLGAITRSGLVSVVGLALVWYIVPLLATHVPSPLNDWLGSLVPGALAGELAGTGNANSVFAAVLSPIEAFVVLIAYTFGPLALAAIAITRTDA